ncbi:MAG: DUF4145 domain-containing protein [Thermoplasmata archaeon]|nr:DUF4145 domain-containing protein [Thermoplasmata archaeon]
MTDGDEIPYDGTYFVARCETCKEILIYHSYTEEDYRSAELYWPNIGLNKAVPEEVSRIYNEAIRIKQLAPNAFAVQIRRALEAVCKNRGTQKHSLAQQLKELAEKGEIPETLSEASDILRLIGNVGAHASETEVHPLQATAIDQFFKAIVSYVYVSPAMIKEFKENMKKYSKTLETPNDRMQPIAGEPSSG